MKNMISRRNFLAAAGVVAAAGVLTACGGSSSTAASTAAASGSTAAAASGDTIKVGVMGPLSGNVSVYGQAVVNGATLYLKQVNANGGINGKQIEILTEDEQGDATQAVNCFTKMVDEGMTALIGDVTTTPTLAVVAESADYNMPMVTASATAEAVTYDAETDTVNANVFRATFTDPFQGIKMADYAYQKATPRQPSSSRRVLTTTRAWQRTSSTSSSLWAAPSSIRRATLRATWTSRLS